MDIFCEWLQDDLAARVRSTSADDIVAIAEYFANGVAIPAYGCNSSRRTCAKHRYGRHEAMAGIVRGARGGPEPPADAGDQQLLAGRLSLKT